MTTHETPASVDGGPDLLPCPFCGGKPFTHHIEPHEHGISFGGVPMPPHEGSYTVECAGCGLGIIDDTREAVTTTWNTRRPSTRDAALREGGYILAAAHLLTRAYDERTSETTAEVLKSAAASVRALASRPTTPTPDASQGSAPVTGGDAAKLKEALEGLLPVAIAGVGHAKPAARREMFSARIQAALKLLHDIENRIEYAPAAPQGSPLPGGGPRVDEVVEVFTEGQWRPAKVNAVYPDYDAFIWDVLPEGLSDGGSIGGATSVGNAGWRRIPTPRNPPEGGALEGESDSCWQETEHRLLMRLEAMVREIDGSRRGCVRWPDVRKVLQDLTVTRGDEPAIPQGERTWQQERADVVAFAEACAREQDEKAGSCGPALRLFAHMLLRSQHAGASQPPVPAIPQSGDAAKERP